jgi:uncharacterized protein
MHPHRNSPLRAASPESWNVMDSSFARDVADGCALSVRVHPGARKNGVTGIHADALRIALTAPPVDGKANEALIAFLAEALRLPRARITIVAGLRKSFASRGRARPRSQPRSSLSRSVETRGDLLTRYLTVSLAFGATVMFLPSVTVTFRSDAATSAYAICKPFVA